MNKRQMRNSTATLIVLATILFILFNFSTTLDTLEQLFGKHVAITMFSIAIASVDFAGLALIYTSKNTDNEDDAQDADTNDFKTLLATVWIIAMLADLLLTWLWGMIMAWKFTNPDLPPDIQQWGVLIAPAALAIAEAAMRITLVASLAKSGQKWFYQEKVKTSPVHQKQPKRTPKTQPNYAARVSDNYRISQAAKFQAKKSNSSNDIDSRYMG